jgi:hypothetical protein
MEVTKIISEKMWMKALATDDEVFREIFRLARTKSLLVLPELFLDDDVTGGLFYVPSEREGTWQLVKVFTFRQVYQHNKISVNDAHELLERELCLAPCFQQQTESGSTKYWSVEELDVAIREYVGRKGLTDVEAVLELGITFDSYDKIKKDLKFYHDGRVLVSVLRFFKEYWITKPMSTSTRSALFIHQYNRGRSIEDEVYANRCECDGCNLIAVYRCTNPQCGGGLPPKFLCEKHGVFLFGEEEKPRAVCPSCSILLRRGELRGSDVKWPDYC